MFNKLLKALFGPRAPTDLARSSQARWEAWLLPVRDGAPTGDDPSYDDAFLAIKDEVAKLSDIDDTLIVDASERLLKTVAKDVRLAVYYLYGRMRRDGAEGVGDGFELLPARVESRKAALEWLAGSTFTDRLERVHGLVGAPLERTMSSLALILARTAQWPEGARPSLEGLTRRLADRVESPGSGTNAMIDRSGLPQTAPVSAVPTADRVTSTRDLLDQARQMSQYLRDQPHGYLAAYRLMRCIRWDTLTELPPHDAARKTRLIAPRAELQTQLKRLMLQKQWPELLDRIEQAFAEGANHFWLDLQYYAFVGQEHAGAAFACLRDLLATDCALMLDRLSGLEHLAFSDGTPFADDTTLEWIARHATVRDIERGDPVSPVSVSSASTDWAETETQALEIAARQGLDAAFAWLQTLPVKDGERDRFVRQVVMARVAERADRIDTALHLLSAIDGAAQRFHLARWEPSLAFEAKHHLVKLLKIRVMRKDADKVALAQRIDALVGEMTAIDPARAVALVQP